MHTRRTLYLDERWRLSLDGVGKIMVKDGAEATAQNVSNEVRRFTEDTYFNADIGIPHFAVNLGHRVNTSVLRSYLRQAALRAADVKEISDIRLNDFDPAARVLSGSIEFKTAEDSNNGSVRTYF